MRLQQFVGPFTENQILLNKSNITYLQLGIEHPHSIPLSELENVDDSEVIIGVYQTDDISNITQQDFIMFDKDILEFKLNGWQKINVIIRKENNNPYLIINAAYEDAT